jgi:glycosyltransferase involved in cell wall biosynthesis
MIKVCHMTSAHSSNDTRIFYKQCTSLANGGYDVYLVAQGESYEENGVKIAGVPKVSGGRFRRMIQGAKSVYKKALEINADIYQIHDPELLPYALKLKKRGKKVIFDSHEDLIESISDKSYLPKILRPLLHCIFKIYYKIIIKKYSAVITVTPHIYDKLVKLNKNTHIISNPPIVSVDDEIKAYAISRNIVYAGGISSQWCHNIIIEALANCNDVKYILLGSGNEKYLGELKNQPEWKFVEFLGKVPFEEVKENFKKSSVGMAVLMYSGNTDYKSGTLGNTKLFEYMSEALPVVCTDFVLWKEIIDKYKCGICVNPYDVNEISNAINYLLDNPEIAKEMGQNGRRAVLEEFNWGVEEEKLLELYGAL